MRMVEESKKLPAVDWVVHCARHGARAHLRLEGLEKNPPDLKECSLRPGQLPPQCGQNCLDSLTFLCPGSEEGSGD